jgi:hypothetical protein
MPVLNPDHLLDQADLLIAPRGGGAPRQADLRRAISNAYYAVFHALATAAADDFVGRTHRNTPRYALVYRNVDHRVLLQLCEAVTRGDEDTKPNPRAKAELPARYVPYAPRDGFGADLSAVAAAVADLQEKRHSADYDPLFRVSLSDAVAAVSTGRTALTKLRNSGRTRRRAFLALVVFPPRRASAQL